LAVESDCEQSLRFKRFRAVWRAEVAVRILELEHRLARVEASPPVEPGARERAAIEAVRQALCNAQAAIEEPGKRISGHGFWPWLTASVKRFRDWWTGTSGTAAWEYVFQAESELLEFEAESDLRAWLPRLLCWIQDVMPAGGRGARYEERLIAFMKLGEAIDLCLVRQAYQDAAIANGRKHANIRELRNRVAWTTGVLTAGLAIVAGWHALDPHFISMCGSPQPPNNEIHCVNGSSAPQASDVAEVELVGALGGLLSIAFGLGNTSVSPSRTNPRLAQWVLKPAAGAATALIGVLAVQSEVLIAPAGQITESLLLVYAAVFGFSQQLLTQFVDKRASKLIGEPEAPSSGGPKADPDGLAG